MGLNTHEPIYIPEPDYKKPPSLLGIIITAMIPPIWPVTAVLIIKKIMYSVRKKRHADFKNYAAIIGTKPVIDLADIASVMGRPMASVQFDIQSMIDKGYLGREAFIDHSTNQLHICEPQADYRNESTYRNAQAPKQTSRPKAKSAAETVKKPTPVKTQAAKPDIMSEFEETLTRIRELNDQIADGPVSERIDRIGVLTAGIFAIVQMKPERRDEVNKFMNYYLPTTFKLLEMYALMEKQGYQSESIIESRGKIRDMLDMLITAFEKQQDILFKSEVFDVDVNIEVLENMMAQDGLVLPKGADINEFRKTQTM